MAAQRAARTLARRFDKALRPVGRTWGQFSLLMSLNRSELPSIGSVAALLAMDRTTLTANLKPLERRGRLLKLTAAGRIVLQPAVPIRERTHEEAEQRRAQTDFEILRAGLRALS